LARVGPMIEGMVDDDDMNDYDEYIDDWVDDSNEEEESGDDDSDDEEDRENDDEEKDEIVEKFILTFHNGDYDQEFDDALNSDRSVIPPARPTQASYYKPNNWRGRNQIGLEKVKEQLKDCIESVSSLPYYHHSFKLKLKHNGFGHHLMDNEEPIVWHETTLDEYGGQLKAKMMGGNLDSVDIAGIEIENVEMKKECIATLVAILSNGRVTNSITNIQFRNTNLCEEAIISLLKLVDVSSMLTQFFFCHNRIYSMDLACCLSRSLRSHTCINTLWLTDCDLGSNPEMLLTILHSDVESIYLNKNNIDSLGAVKIAEYLEDNPPIKTIFLANNRLNDDDIILISQALKRNTNLEDLYLHTNNITCIGVKALLTCIFDSSSLNAISESNHSLKLLFFFNGEESENLDECIHKLIDLNPTEKIMLALQDKESLLQYFTNIPVELIPEVLAFFHPIHCPHKCLNILYSTMRWWNMPMLYSYHEMNRS
jgi:hypothetical protein